MQKNYHRRKVKVDYAAIGQMAPGVLHDIGNAVTSLSLNMEMLRMSDGVDRESIEQSMLSLNEISLLVDNFKSQMQNKKTQEYFSLNQVLNDVCTSLTAKLDSLDINFFRDTKSAYLYGNISVFHRMVLNLLTNAIEAVVRNERPTKEITIKSRVGRKYIVLEIIDNGIGIRSSHLEKIFKPYFSTKKDQKLNGVGLAVVKEAVQEFAGAISVSSQYGDGTCFTIRIPKLKY